VDRATALAERLVDALEHHASGPGLYAGCAGTGFVLEQMRGRVLDDGPELLRPLDELLVAAVERRAAPQCRGAHDLVYGLVGIGVYALERAPESTALRLARIVVERLAATAERDAEGCRWWSSPADLPVRARATLASGYYNVGMAHGAPGVIAFLADVVRLGIETSIAPALLSEAVRWLLAQHGRAPGCEALYPSWIDSLGEATPARVAWCYGDPGVAVALLAAANALHNDGWREAALMTARHAAAVAFEPSGVIDACLCHGSAGLATVFAHLEAGLGAPELGDAARRWTCATLAFEQAHGPGVGGYRSWTRLPDGSDGWADDPGFLLGSSGVALALLARAGHPSHGWERLLLASPRASLAR
jgi:lantibiotic modifying enzyme